MGGRVGRALLAKGAVWQGALVAHLAQMVVALAVAAGAGGRAAVGAGAVFGAGNRQDGALSTSSPLTSLWQRVQRASPAMTLSLVWRLAAGAADDDGVVALGAEVVWAHTGADDRSQRVSSATACRRAAWSVMVWAVRGWAARG